MGIRPLALFVCLLLFACSAVETAGVFLCILLVNLPPMRRVAPLQPGDTMANQKSLLRGHRVSFSDSFLPNQLVSNTHVPRASEEDLSRMACRLFLRNQFKEDDATLCWILPSA